ncbi:hypothetical protein M2323_001990 [Rhodoblastus acidophilus]|uniref:hypothetical protein n=1 Tax=Rhodoblastus acidophilus TaxID=1074 RepID=UPI00222450EC|nr:hypothetical protein [Rhodoblastus acidophilus]MCW2285696.1 hypothetical protein [Rhodoblastus acidophilus]MCW2333068.1 hypothetical protein [Rhodoblastus acidophilus]
MFRSIQFLAAVISAISLSSCAYEAKVASTPAYDTVTSFGSKLPGRWQIVADAGALNAVVKPETELCSAHEYPLDFTQGFAGSVNSTLANLVEQSEPAEQSSPSKSARGIIVVRGESIEGHLKATPGMFAASISADVTIAASVAVDGHSGRLFGKTLEAHGSAQGPAGFACGNGSQILRTAAEKAQKSLSRKIGEEIANSERVRAAAGRT